MKKIIYIIIFVLLGCDSKKEEIIYYENGNVKSKGFLINELKYGDIIRFPGILSF